MGCLGAKIEARQDCVKGEGGEGMMEILRCVICEFTGVYHIVTPMIHQPYITCTLVNANNIKHKMRRRPQIAGMIQNPH